VAEVEKHVISRALEESRGDVARAADRLQIPARVLMSKMNGLGL
jgi:transcriptional regulator with PAS, ATPase and Fis domain